MPRPKAPLNRIIDAANMLPLPQAITAYPLDWVAAILEAGSRTFFVARTLPNGQPLPYSGLDIERMLTAKGIRVWGKMIVFDDIMFTVKRQQADYAEDLLVGAKIDYTRTVGVWEALGYIFS